MILKMQSMSDRDIIVVNDADADNGDDDMGSVGSVEKQSAVGMGAIGRLHRSNQTNSSLAVQLYTTSEPPSTLWRCTQHAPCTVTRPTKGG